MPLVFSAPAGVRFSLWAGHGAALGCVWCQSLQGSPSSLQEGFAADTAQAPRALSSFHPSSDALELPPPPEAAGLWELRKSPAEMNPSLTELDPAQAQLAAWFSGKGSFPIHIHSYIVSFPHSNVLISLKCFSSIFLLQCHFLKISMLPWKYWIMPKIHSQVGNTGREMLTSFSSERSHSVSRICKASFILREIFFGNLKLHLPCPQSTPKASSVPLTVLK